ncbi:MAG: hypothetical protein IVW52_21215 [Acidimicrobiales bacterium]|nr:hypothetical protein [Acidimicrobiales bacterium]
MPEHPRIPRVPDSASAILLVELEGGRLDGSRLLVTPNIQGINAPVWDRERRLLNFFYRRTDRRTCDCAVVFSCL